jgi:hypothetical protein
VVAARCELALCGPADPADDLIGFLLGADQLVRMGEPADAIVPEVASAVEQLVRKGADGRNTDWTFAAALDAAGRVFAKAGEQRAVRDVAAMESRLRLTSQPLPASCPDDLARAGAWLELRCADRSGALLPEGMPPSWLGASVEVYGVPIGVGSSVSYALRWHGERPAVLWECIGSEVALSAPVVAPDWRTAEPKGEALWPVPPGAQAAASSAQGGGSLAIDGDGISFG